MRWIVFATFALCLGLLTWGTLPTATVTLSTSLSNGSYVPAMTGTASVTWTSAATPKVLPGQFKGVYDSATGVMTWTVPKNSQVRFVCGMAGVDGLFAIGDGDTYSLNALVPVSVPAETPPWASNFLYRDGTNAMTAPLPLRGYATASLPTPTSDGTLAFDTTLDTITWWDGSAWQVPSTSTADPRLPDPGPDGQVLVSDGGDWASEDPVWLPTAGGRLWGNAYWLMGSEGLGLGWWVHEDDVPTFALSAGGRGHGIYSLSVTGRESGSLITCVDGDEHPITFGAVPYVGSDPLLLAETDPRLPAEGLEGEVLSVVGGAWTSAAPAATWTPPAETGKDGRVLTTNGTAEAWTHQYVPGNVALALGDSKSAEGNSWPIYLGNDLAVSDAACWTVIPLGTPGDRASDLYGRIAGLIATVPDKAAVKIVTLNVGANDMATDPATFGATYCNIILAIRSAFSGASLYCSKVWRRGYASECAALNTRIATAVGSCGGALGDDETVWLEGGDNGATNTTDGIHYSDAGSLAKAALVNTEVLASHKKTITPPMLPTAAADYGAADVNINLGNSNSTGGSWVTNVTTDGSITASSGFVGGLTGTASGNLTAESDTLQSVTGRGASTTQDMTVNRLRQSKRYNPDDPRSATSPSGWPNNGTGPNSKDHEYEGESISSYICKSQTGAPKTCPSNLTASQFSGFLHCDNGGTGWSDYIAIPISSFCTDPCEYDVVACFEPPANQSQYAGVGIALVDGGGTGYGTFFMQTAVHGDTAQVSLLQLAGWAWYFQGARSLYDVPPKIYLRAERTLTDIGDANTTYAHAAVSYDGKEWYGIAPLGPGSGYYRSPIEYLVIAWNSNAPDNDSRYPVAFDLDWIRFNKP